jgi:hypothetical protein
MPRRFGKCHLCGKPGELSFEHVPPRKAFNERPVVKAQFEDIIGLGPDEQIRGTIQQRGAGGYTLCPKCNNDTGRWYGVSFIDWCYQGFEILEKTNGKPTLIYLNYLFPLRIIKQIITMFFSVNGSEFGDANPELVKFVLNREQYNLSPKYRFFVYYNISGRFRFVGASAKVDSHTREIITLSEINFPPYGYVMTFGSAPPESRLFEITYFSKYRYKDHVVKAMKLPVLPTHMWFPGDYRTKEEIEKQAKSLK